MPKERMVVHPEQTTRDCLPTRFSEVTITLRDGRRLQRRVDQAKGQPKNPLTDAELTGKFRDCAARALPAAQVDALLASLSALEQVRDVSELARRLGAAAR
jgi:2-methylcitrate dehydratase PrpD